MGNSQNTFKPKRALRHASLIVTLIFGLQQIAFAAPTSQPISNAIPSISLSQIIQDPSLMDIPFENVSVKEFYKGNSDKLIIHIQDAHANYSGQKNLAETLDHLMTQYGFSLVLSEGASKDATLNDIKAVASAKSWKLAAKRLLMEGIIKGEEYINLATDHPIKIMGIEDKGLYNQSLISYSDLAEQRKNTLLYIHHVRTSLSILKNKLYSEDLLQYEEATKDHDANLVQDDFNELLGLVGKTNIDLASSYPESFKLRGLQILEKGIDFDKANSEQASLMNSLKNKGAKSEVEAFMEASKKTKASQIAQFMLINNMLALAESKGLSPANYPNLQVYREYLSSFSNIKMDEFLNELDQLEDEVYKSLLVEEDARRVRAIDRFIDLLEKAYKIKLSSTEFQMLLANENDFKTQSWQAFMNEKLASFGKTDALIAYKNYFEEAKDFLHKFYELVDQRDFAFITKAKASMQTEDQDVAFLVAGGYHTQHITELLREEDTSYIVLTPIVTQETDHEKYEERLLMPVKLNQMTSDTLRDILQGVDAHALADAIKAGVFTNFFTPNENAGLKAAVNQRLLQQGFVLNKGGIYVPRMAQQTSLDEALSDLGISNVEERSEILTGYGWKAEDLTKLNGLIAQLTDWRDSQAADKQSITTDPDIRKRLDEIVAKEWDALTQSIKSLDAILDQLIPIRQTLTVKVDQAEFESAIAGARVVIGQGSYTNRVDAVSRVVGWIANRQLSPAQTLDALAFLVIRSEDRSGQVRNVAQQALEQISQKSNQFSQVSDDEAGITNLLKRTGGVAPLRLQQQAIELFRTQLATNATTLSKFLGVLTRITDQIAEETDDRTTPLVGNTNIYSNLAYSFDLVSKSVGQGLLDQQGEATFDGLKDATISTLGLLSEWADITKFEANKKLRLNAISALSEFATGYYNDNDAIDSEVAKKLDAAGEVLTTYLQTISTGQLRSGGADIGEVLSALAQLRSTAPTWERVTSLIRPRGQFQNFHPALIDIAFNLDENPTLLVPFLIDGIIQSQTLPRRDDEREFAIKAIVALDKIFPKTNDLSAELIVAVISKYLEGIAVTWGDGGRSLGASDFEHTTNKAKLEGILQSVRDKQAQNRGEEVEGDKTIIFNAWAYLLSGALNKSRKNEIPAKSVAKFFESSGLVVSADLIESLAVKATVYKDLPEFPLDDLISVRMAPQELARLNELLTSVQNFFASSHPIQPSLSIAIALIDGGNYQTAWEQLQQTQDIATDAYNIFGLSKWSESKVPVELYYEPLKRIIEARVGITQYLQEQGLSLVAGKTQRDLQVEAADIVRRYGGAADRYDPQTTEALRDQIRAEYMNRGIALDLDVLDHIDQVIDLLEIRSAKPSLKVPVDASILAEVSQSKSPEYAYTQLEVQNIKDILSLDQAEWTEHTQSHTTQNKKIPNTRLLYGITKLGLAGNGFAYGPRELKSRLNFIYDSAAVDAMLSLITIDDGRIQIVGDAVSRFFRLDAGEALSDEDLTEASTIDFEELLERSFAELERTVDDFVGQQAFESAYRATDAFSTFSYQHGALGMLERSLELRTKIKDAENLVLASQAIQPTPSPASQTELAGTYGNALALAHNIDKNVIDLVANAGNDFEIAVIVRRIENTLAVAASMLQANNAANQSIQAFEAQNPLSADSVTSQLAIAPQNDWHAAESGTKRYIEYNQTIHDILFLLAKNGYLFKSGESEESALLDEEAFEDPSQKTKIATFAKSGYYQINAAGIAYLTAILDEDRIVDVVTGEFQALVENERKAITDILAEGKEVSNIAADFDTLIGIQARGQRSRDQQAFRQGKIAQIYNLQKASAKAIILGLQDQAILEKLASTDDADIMLGLVGLIRLINLIWRIDNNWYGYDNDLIKKYFGTDDKQGIGLAMILKDAIVLKTVMQILIDKQGAFTWHDEASAVLFEQALSNPNLARVLNDQLLDEAKLKVAVDNDTVGQEFVVEPATRMAKPDVVSVEFDSTTGSMVERGPVAVEQSPSYVWQNDEDLPVLDALIEQLNQLSPYLAESNQLKSLRQALVDKKGGTSDERAQAGLVVSEFNINTLYVALTQYPWQVADSTVLGEIIDNLAEWQIIQQDRLTKISDDQKVGERRTAVAIAEFDALLESVRGLEESLAQLNPIKTRLNTDAVRMTEVERLAQQVRLVTEAQSFSLNFRLAIPASLVDAIRFLSLTTGAGQTLDYAFSDAAVGQLGGRTEFDRLEDFRRTLSALDQSSGPIVDALDLPFSSKIALPTNSLGSPFANGIPNRIWDQMARKDLAPAIRAYLDENEELKLMISIPVTAGYSEADLKGLAQTWSSIPGITLGFNLVAEGAIVDLETDGTKNAAFLDAARLDDTQFSVDGINPIAVAIEAAADGEVVDIALAVYIAIALAITDMASTTDASRFRMENGRILTGFSNKPTNDAILAMDTFNITLVSLLKTAYMLRGLNAGQALERAQMTALAVETSV